MSTRQTTPPEYTSASQAGDTVLHYVVRHSFSMHHLPGALVRRCCKIENRAGYTPRELERGLSSCKAIWLEAAMGSEKDPNSEELISRSRGLAGVKVYNIGSLAVDEFERLGLR